MTIFTEKEDLLAVVDALSEKEELDSKNLFLFGGSQGGLVSALTAEEIKDKVRGLVLLFFHFTVSSISLFYFRIFFLTKSVRSIAALLLPSSVNP